MDEIVYFDNAATSFPKPPEVVQAVVDCLIRAGGNPGRSGHRLSLEAARIVFNTREAIANLFGVNDSSRIIFTINATEAINLALFGIVDHGSQVVTTSMEHNAVMRPLRYLEKTMDVSVTVAECRRDGMIDLEKFASALRENTRLIVVNHVSNVTGTIQPLEEIAVLKGDIPLLVDAAQSAGAISIDVKKMGIDLLAFSGHKSLLGPMGTGGLYIRPGLLLRPLKFGGTGSNSGAEEMPEFLPDIYESGTLNVAGLAGLGAGVQFIMKTDISNIRTHEIQLIKRMFDGLKEMEGIEIYGPRNPLAQTATISFNIEGYSPSELSEILDREYNIMTRPGLQCSPVSHRTLGTYREGTLRVSMGYFNREDEVDYFIESLKKVVGR